MRLPRVDVNGCLIVCLMRCGLILTWLLRLDIRMRLLMLIRWLLMIRLCMWQVILDWRLDGLVVILMLLLRVMWNRLVNDLKNRLLYRLFMVWCRCRVRWNWLDGWRLWLGWITRYCLNILLISVERLGMVMVLLLLRQFMVRVMRCDVRVVRLVREIRCVSLNGLNLILFVQMIWMRKLSVLNLIGYMIGL